MGTRGMYGFYKNGVTKATYNHSDSYPNWLGKFIVKFITETTIEEMNDIFDRIVMVNGDSKPTVDQINECIQFFTADVGSDLIDDWYNLLRLAQGDLTLYKQGLKYMIDNSDFILDSLFCEWTYIINLDENVLEIYKGFQKEAEYNRYYDDFLENEEYKNCKLVLTLPIERIQQIGLSNTVAILNEYSSY